MLSKIIINFLIGGIIISTTLYLLDNVSGKYAAIFATVPFASIPVMLGFYLQRNNPKEVRNFVLELLFGSIGAIFYILSYSLASDYIFNKSEHVILYSYILSLLVWIISTFTLYKLDIDEFIKLK